MEEEKILEEIKYDTPVKGISVVSDNLVTIIGERQTEIEGKVVPQYVYTIDGYDPSNGKPFVSHKGNIVVLK